MLRFSEETVWVNALLGRATKCAACCGLARTSGLADVKKRDSSSDSACAWLACGNKTRKATALTTAWLTRRIKTGLLRFLVVFGKARRGSLAGREMSRRAVTSR